MTVSDELKRYAKHERKTASCCLIIFQSLFTWRGRAAVRGGDSAGKPRAFAVQKDSAFTKERFSLNNIILRGFYNQASQMFQIFIEIMSGKRTSVT